MQNNELKKNRSRDNVIKMARMGKEAATELSKEDLESKRKQRLKTNAASDKRRGLAARAALDAKIALEGDKRAPPAAAVLRHRAVLKKFVEGGMKSMDNAAREMGYEGKTPSTRLVKTASFQALMQEFMPDDQLMKTHMELLLKRDMVKTSVWDDAAQKVVDKWLDMGPDTAAASKALDMAYKLKGAYRKEEEEDRSKKVYNLFYKPEIRQNLKTFEDMIKLKIYEQSLGENSEFIPDEIKRAGSFPLAGESVGGSEEGDSSSDLGEEEGDREIGEE